MNCEMVSVNNLEYDFMCVPEFAHRRIVKAVGTMHVQLYACITHRKVKILKIMGTFNKVYPTRSSDYIFSNLVR